MIGIDYRQIVSTLLFCCGYKGVSESNYTNRKPKCILNEHHECSMAFRYESEGRSGDPILGDNSTLENKTYLSIEIVGYTGQAIVFIDDKKGDFVNPLYPIVSEPIYEMKAMSELKICRVCTCPAGKNDQIVWQDYGSFKITDVRSIAIAFTLPPCRIKNIKRPVDVFIQLKRPSDGLLSEPVPFRYSPSISDDEQLKRKIYSTSRKFLRMQALQRQRNQWNISGIKQVSDDVSMLLDEYSTVPSTSTPYVHSHQIELRTNQ
uniref:RHD domain-containing protein n=1 Tax=Glossina austeni TaxID=7395 RepID=A0A1A9VII7_GLOAU